MLDTIHLSRVQRALDVLPGNIEVDNLRALRFRPGSVRAWHRVGTGDDRWRWETLLTWNDETDYFEDHWYTSEDIRTALEAVEILLPGHDVRRIVAVSVGESADYDDYPEEALYSLVNPFYSVKFLTDPVLTTWDGDILNAVDYGLIEV